MPKQGGGRGGEGAGGNILHAGTQQGGARRTESNFFHDEISGVRSKGGNEFAPSPKRERKGRRAGGVRKKERSAKSKRRRFLIRRRGASLAHRPDGDPALRSSVRQRGHCHESLTLTPKRVASRVAQEILHADMAKRPFFFFPRHPATLATAVVVLVCLSLVVATHAKAEAARGRGRTRMTNKARIAKSTLTVIPIRNSKRCFNSFFTFFPGHYSGGESL